MHVCSGVLSVARDKDPGEGMKGSILAACNGEGAVFTQQSQAYVCRQEQQQCLQLYNTSI